MSTLKQAEIKKVDIELVEPNDYNPNEMDDSVFNSLSEDLSQEELDQPIVVREVDGKYIIVDGEHRWRAAKVNGYPQVYISVKDIDERAAKIATVRRNALRGNLNPVAFTKLVKNLAEGSSLEELKTKMAMREKEFNKAFLGMTEQKQIDVENFEGKDVSAKKAAVVANLSEMVRHIMLNHAEDMESGYIYFMHKGTAHLMVSMDSNLKKAVVELHSIIQEDNLSNEEVCKLLAGAMKGIS